ncbi:MAG: LPS export ABC transporter permease LptG [Desulfuromonadia bacterium]
MTILSRYVMRIFAAMFAVSLASFSSIYLIIDFLEKISRFSRSGGGSGKILTFLFLQGIDVTAQMTPLALLMASVLTIGSLVRNSELVVITMAGISIVRLARPMLLTGLAMSLFLLLFGETTLPGIRSHKNDLKALLSGKKPPSVTFHQNDIWYRDREAIISISHFIPGERKVLGVSILSFDPDFTLTERIEARQGYLDKGSLQLDHVTLYRFKDGGIESFETLPSLPHPTTLSLEDLREIEKQADSMSFGMLRGYARKLASAGSPSPRWETLMAARLAEPFAAFVMTLVGIPFAVGHARGSGPAQGIALSIVTALSYFVANSLAISLGQNAILPPMVAGWITPLLFLLLGGVLLKRSSG